MPPGRLAVFIESTDLAHPLAARAIVKQGDIEQSLGSLLIPAHGGKHYSIACEGSRTAGELMRVGFIARAMRPSTPPMYSAIL